MTIPLKYQQPIESTIASYNFTDIASGEGFVRFYAARLSGSDILTSNIIYSEDIVTGTNFVDGGSDPALVKTINFDTSTFVIPRRIGGTAAVNIPAELASTSATGSVVADIKRVDAAGAATSLISGSSAFATGSSIEKMFSIPLIIPSTLIKIGEKIRLTIEQWRNDSGGSPAASTHYLGHDPKNRADTTITTIDTNLIIDIPF